MHSTKAIESWYVTNVMYRRSMPCLTTVVKTIGKGCNKTGSARCSRYREGGGNVLRSVKILTYTLTLKAIHLNFHVAVKYHNVLNLEMVVI
jgi:hypothetical protein